MSMTHQLTCPFPNIENQESPSMSIWTIYISQDLEFSCPCYVTMSLIPYPSYILARLSCMYQVVSVMYDVIMHHLQVTGIYF